jgi:hypothetical protein
MQTRPGFARLVPLAAIAGPAAGGLALLVNAQRMPSPPQLAVCAPSPHVNRDSSPTSRREVASDRAFPGGSPGYIDILRYPHLARLTIPLQEDWLLWPREWLHRLGNPLDGGTTGHWLVASVEASDEFLRLVDVPALETMSLPGRGRGPREYATGREQLAYGLYLWSWAILGDGDRQCPAIERERRYALASEAFRGCIARFPEQRKVGTYARLALDLTVGHAAGRTSSVEPIGVVAAHPEFPQRCLAGQQRH